MYIIQQKWHEVADVQKFITLIHVSSCYHTKTSTLTCKGCGKLVAINPLTEYFCYGY